MLMDVGASTSAVSEVGCDIMTSMLVVGCWSAADRDEGLVGMVLGIVVMDSGVIVEGRLGGVEGGTVTAVGEVVVETE